MAERTLQHRQSRRDLLLTIVLRCATIVSVGILMLIFCFVLLESLPALRTIGVTRLFTDSSWHPTSNTFSIAPMIVGSAAVTAGSLLVTAPLGLGSAIFLRFYAPPSLGLAYRRVLEVLAGVPSVVFGLWGLSVLVPTLAQVSPLGQGQCLLAGVFILSMMTLPTVAVSADAALGAVPTDQIQAGLALGLGRGAVIWKIVVPAARSGIVTGMMLQIGRALGETMAVLMVCGNIVQIPGSLFDPVRTLTATIALEMGYADTDHRSVLFVCGLILLLIIAALMLVVDVLLQKWNLTQTSRT